VFSCFMTCRYGLADNGLTIRGPWFSFQSRSDRYLPIQTKAISVSPQGSILNMSLLQTVNRRSLSLTVVRKPRCNGNSVTNVGLYSSFLPLPLSPVQNRVGYPFPAMGVFEKSCTQAVLTFTSTPVTNALTAQPQPVLLYSQ